MATLGADVLEGAPRRGHPVRVPAPGVGDQPVERRQSLGDEPVGNCHQLHEAELGGAVDERALR
jgi:hypothetical protein